MTTKENRAAEQASAQLENIVKRMKSLKDASEEKAEEIREEILQQDALSVQTRSAWRTPGVKDEVDVEFEILLSTGGPAVRIIGDLDDHAQLVNPMIEFQDWGTPWTKLTITGEQIDALNKFCDIFYFGE